MSQLNSEIKAKMGLGGATEQRLKNGNNLQSYINKPLRASASVLQMEKYGNEKGSDENKSNDGEEKAGNFPKLNRYNIRTLNQSH